MADRRPALTGREITNAHENAEEMVQLLREIVNPAHPAFVLEGNAMVDQPSVRGWAWRLLQKIEGLPRCAACGSREDDHPHRHPFQP